MKKKNRTKNISTNAGPKAKQGRGIRIPPDPTRKQPPIRKGEWKKTLNLQKRIGLLEGFARGLALTKPSPESSPENLSFGAHAREGREREMPSRLFGQGLPSSDCNS